MDCVYFSFTAYTTLGFGDIVPHGDLRFLAGARSVDRTGPDYVDGLLPLPSND